MGMRTFIYVDGFNLYNRSLKGTPYKWLDLLKLSQMLLNKRHEIRTIRYFTARVSELGDPKRPSRQETYIRALKKHIPSFRVQYGNFQSHVKTALVACPLLRGYWVQVQEIKEKGTDVNLAVQLLHDAWRNYYDCAVILSNDSDLIRAIEIVKKDHKKLIGIFIPDNCNPSVELTSLAHFVKHIRKSTLSAAQLPNPIPGTNIRKPAGW